jgi:hypothetical protein
MRAKNSLLGLIDIWVNGRCCWYQTTLTQVDELEIDFIFSIALLLPG